MTKMMRAMRLHAVGEPFQVDTIPVPDVRPTDVLVEVKAAGVVPNLRIGLDLECAGGLQVHEADHGCHELGPVTKAHTASIPSDVTHRCLLVV